MRLDQITYDCKADIFCYSPKLLKKISHLMMEYSFCFGFFLYFLNYETLSSPNFSIYPFLHRSYRCWCDAASIWLAASPDAGHSLELRRDKPQWISN